MLAAVAAVAAVSTSLLACGNSQDGTPDAGADAQADTAFTPSLLPADYATYQTVRDCRNSIDHDLNRILIKAAPSIASLYLDGPFPFPTGTVIVKEEFSDPGCTTRVGTTLMRKEAPGTAPQYGDWRWQKLDVSGRVLLDGAGAVAPVARCASCHAAADCRARDFTCAEP